MENTEGTVCLQKGKKSFHPALDEQLGACQGKQVQLTRQGQGCGK